MTDQWRSGYVYVQNRLAGIISETAQGYSFAYLPTYLAQADALAVSLSLPLQEQVYHSDQLFSFFDGLIPEGWLLEIASRNWKIERNDRFGLLLSVCHDCIGDVSIRREKK